MTDQHDLIQTQVRQFILEDLLRDPHYPLSADEALFSSRLIDSFGLAELAVFIQREYDIYIPDSEMTAEAMDTLSQITDRIAKDV
jgi:acyl carrier protein